MKLLMFLLFIPIASAAPIVSYQLGEDYWLPDYISQDDWTGFICSNCDNSDMKMMWLGWDDFEPERGVYDFSELEDQLAEADAVGKKAFLHLPSGVYNGTNADGSIIVRQTFPDWVLTEYGLDPDTLPYFGPPWELRVIPQWWPGIRGDFHNMLAALKASGYTADPRQ